MEIIRNQENQESRKRPLVSSKRGKILFLNNFDSAASAFNCDKEYSDASACKYKLVRPIEKSEFQVSVSYLFSSLPIPPQGNLLLATVVHSEPQRKGKKESF